MKNIFTFFSVIFLSCFFSSKTFSQTLSFNRVKLVTSVTDTVPAGKIWKVESVLATNTMVIYCGTSSSQSRTVNIEVNGTTVYIKASWGDSGGTSSIETTDLPIWLPAGTTLRAAGGASAVSVIEFNVVP